MKVHIDRDHKDLEIDFKGKAIHLLEQLAINPETVVITKNGEIVTEDEKLKNSDEVKIISVVSGG